MLHLDMMELEIAEANYLQSIGLETRGYFLLYAWGEKSATLFRILSSKNRPFSQILC